LFHIPWQEHSIIEQQSRMYRLFYNSNNDQMRAYIRRYDTDSVGVHTTQTRSTIFGEKPRSLTSNCQHISGNKIAGSSFFFGIY